MKALIHRALTVAELGAIVCENLKKHGIEVVLTGGSVVSIYSHNEYRSFDLDFIIQGLSKKVDQAMIELGFEQEKGRPFSHPDTEFTVEFPAGPLMVGEQPVKEIDELKTSKGKLRLLPPTECVMDRLSAYIHFKDPQALEQAVMVAKAQPLKLEKVKKWALREGAQDEYQEFEERLRQLKGVHH
jgi:hypothetical protein